MTDPLLNSDDYCLVWGPLKLPDPAYSFDDHWETKIYRPQEMADAILQVPGVRLTHPAQPGWENWKAEWREGERFIRFDLMACEIDADNEIRPGVTLAWGGSSIAISCRLSEALKVWNAIRQRCPAVWLHDTDCVLYSPESFAREFGRIRPSNDGGELTTH